MKSLPAFVALAAICATSVAVTGTIRSGGNIPTSQVEESLKVEPFAITIDELALPIASIDEFDESVIPETVKALNGKRVRLVGLMQWHLHYQKQPVSKFVFHGYAQRETDLFEELTSHHYVRVSLKKGTTVTTTPNAIEVEGRLVIRPHFANDKSFQFYFLEDAVVRPAEPPKGFHQPPWLFPIFTC